MLSSQSDSEEFGEALINGEHLLLELPPPKGTKLRIWSCAHAGDEVRCEVGLIESSTERLVDEAGVVDEPSEIPEVRVVELSSSAC